MRPFFGRTKSQKYEIRPFEFKNAERISYSVIFVQLAPVGKAIFVQKVENFKKVLIFVRAYVIINARAKIGGELMSPKGRPTTNKKTERLEVRLAPNELALMQECANKLGVSKTEVINKGVKLVKAEIDKK